MNKALKLDTMKKKLTIPVDKVILVFFVLIFFVSCKKDASDSDKTPLVIGSIMDSEGNSYKVIQLGKQIWMGENLRSSRLSDNTYLEFWGDEHIDNMVPAYSIYDQNYSFRQDYGFLYNFAAIETNKLCPVGFHVPGKDDWLALADYLGGVGIAGGKLKEKGTFHWNSPNTRATNESLMSIIPGGSRLSNNLFHLMGKEAHLWTSTSASPEEAFSMLISNTHGQLNVIEYSLKTNAYSIRCMRNIDE